MLTITNNNYDKNIFIFGESVSTEIGEIRFLTYREFLTNMTELQLISQNSLHIYYYYRKQLQEVNASKEELEALKVLKDMDLFELVVSTPQLLNAYSKIFQLVFDRNEQFQSNIAFSSREGFHFIRSLVMDMNVLLEEKVSSNDEIQGAIERSKRVKQENSQEQSFVDIVTSIVASTNNSFDDVCNMNVFQVYAIYARVGAIFNYQTTTLFATVAEKVNIESWNKHIDLFKVEDDSISRKDFESKFGSLLKM